MRNKEHAAPTMECDCIEEGVDLHNVVVSWESGTSNVTLSLSNKNLPVIQAIVDEGSRVYILSWDTYEAWGLPPLEKALFIIKLTNQSCVTLVGLARDILI